MIRHGYVNCTSCHVSPAGGGVLTPYGREISRELLSTWGSEKESEFLYGAFSEKEAPEWLRAGGDARAVQVLQDNSRIQKADFIPMQADLEIGVDEKTVAAVVSVGVRSYGSASTRDLNQFFSRRHYILIRTSEENSVRIGKFMKNFGLNLADHIVSFRRGLGWDYGTESYNLEYAHLGERVSYYLSLVSDDPEEAGIQRENGFAGTLHYSFWDNSKVGFSYFYGRSQGSSRDVFGPYWILSFSPKVFWMSEFDWQLKNPSNDSRSSGYAAFSRLGYEPTKGIIPFLQFERTLLDTTSTAQLRDAVSAGLQWFPRPHWEFQGLASQVRSAEPQDLTWYYWLMGHFYF
jgi:hypothetical protein